MINMEYYSQKAAQFKMALQILAMVQPVLVQLFQIAENLLPTGAGSEKLAFVKEAIQKALADVPGLPDQFEAAWSALSGIISAIVTISKKTGAVVPAAPAAPAQSPAAPSA